MQFRVPRRVLPRSSGPAEEADNPRHVLLRCPALVGRRLARLDSMHPSLDTTADTAAMQNGGIIAALTAFRAHLTSVGTAAAACRAQSGKRVSLAGDRRKQRRKGQVGRQK